MAEPIRVPEGPFMPFYGQGPYWTATWDRMREDAQQVYGFPLGLEYCDWSEDWTHLNEVKDILVERFNQRYAYRECAHETPQAMQHFLQRRLYVVGAKCEMMFRVYAENDLERIGLGYDETIDFTEHGENEMEGSGNTEGMSEFEDTPTTASTPVINNPTNRSRDTGTTASSSNGTSDITRSTEHRKRQYDRQAIEYVRELFQKWEDLDDLFVMQFEPLFMGVIERFGIDNI